MLVHVCADLATHFYGEPGTTTVRGTASRPPKSVFVRRLTFGYALYQFLAMGSHLVDGPAGDLAFNAYIGVQSSAFCMTLNRKNLIHWRTHALVYSVCILMSSVYIIQTVPQILLPVLVSFFIRTQLGVSKYVVWPLYSAFMRFA